MEEEGEDQENEKEDEGEDGKQRVEGRVVENQNNHIMACDDVRDRHLVIEPMSV